MNTNRRGIPSNDPEAIARRKWYEDMRAYSAEQAESGLASSTSITNSSLPSGQQKQQGFVGGFAMALANESAATKNGTNTVKVAESKGSEEVFVYARPSDFDASRWIYNLNKPSSPIARLLCFHGIGFNHLFFNSWGKFFEEKNIALCAVCLPGRMHRIHEKCTSLIHASHAIADSISVYKEGIELHDVAVGWHTAADVPLFFFGHDMGAILAFEVAKIETTLQLCSHLIVSSTKSPTALTAHNSDRFQTKFYCSSEGDLVARAHHLGGITGILSDRKTRRELLKLLMTTIRSDFTLYEKYRMVKDKAASADAAELACPITAVGAAEDRSCATDDLDSWASETCSTQFLRHEFRSGGHTWMNVASKEKDLLEYLAQICSGSTAPTFPAEADEWA